jgi:hypothetical protein
LNDPLRGTAHAHGLAGWLALGVLSALMLVTALAGVYAAYLWPKTM